MKARIEAVEVIPLRIPFADPFAQAKPGAARGHVDVAVVRKRDSPQPPPIVEPAVLADLDGT